MFTKIDPVRKAKKEAANYLKITAAMSMIPSPTCKAIAQAILELEPDDNRSVAQLLKEFTAKGRSSKPLKGCHRHFREKLRIVYQQIKYDSELQETLNSLENPILFHQTLPRVNGL